LSDDLSLSKAVMAQYSFPRIQWLVGAMSIVSLLYLSSEEIWRAFDSQPFPEVTSEGAVIYTIFFLAMLVLVHYYDIRRLVQRRFLAFIASSISIALDVILLSSAELVVLTTIQVLPKDISNIVFMLLIGALPSSLGVTVLTSLTSATLKKRAKKLYEEARSISQQVDELERQRKMAMKSLEQFEKKKREFETSIEKTEKSD
jgi:fumarate reductase subunit C